MSHAISFPQPEPDPIQHSFAQAPQADIERSTFALSHAINLLTFVISTPLFKILTRNILTPY